MKSRIRKWIVKLVKLLIKKYNINHHEVGKVEQKIINHYHEPIQLKARFIIEDHEVAMISSFKMEDFVEMRKRRHKADFVDQLAAYVKEKTVIDHHRQQIHIEYSLTLYDETK